MRPRLMRLRPPARYGSAIAIIAVATALRFALSPVWGVGLPYITFYPAVMFSAWLGGFGPGLVATALSALIADYFWISPAFSLAIGEVPDTLGLLVFIAMGVVISALNEAWRRSTRGAFESQQRLAVTLTSIGDGVIATDAKGCVTRMNPVAQLLVGWSEREATGRPLHDVFVIVNEHTRKPVSSPVDRVLAQGGIVALANHTILIARDGREIPIDDSAAPIRDEKGDITGVVMIFRDITERRRVERQREAAALALRESEERLRITFASIGDAVLVTDEQGRITQLNPVGETLTGWREADAIGRPIQEVFVIVNEDTRQPAPHPVERVLRDGVIAGLANHTVLISKAGNEIPIDDSAAPVQASDGRLLGAVMVFRDITERRQAERERAARGRVTRELAAIVESSDDAIVSKDLDGVITAWNRAAEQMYGYSASEAVGQPIRLIVPDDLVKEEESVLQRIRQGERVDHFETRRRRKDGTTIPVSITVSPIRDDAGAVIGASKVARDISGRAEIETERARLLDSERTAREKLEVAVQQLQTALNAGRMGTWEYALRTATVKWSPGLEAIHGYAPGTFPGTLEAFRSEIHPEDRDRVLQAIAEAAEERRDHHIEYRIVRADGAVRWVEGRGQVVLDQSQQPERMVGVCADITERRQAEERFRMAVDAAPAAMLLVDQGGTIVLTNALTEQFLGYTRDEIIGQPLDRLVPPRFRELHPGYRKGFFAEPRQRPMGAGRELYALRKDGSEVPVEIGLSPIHTHEGMFVLAAVTDITERKQIEAQRAKLLDREREARAELERASHMKDEFLAVLSHELRTPLNAVLGYAHLLGAGALQPDRTKHAIDAIQRNAQAQTRLVESLLDLSRIMAGKLELDVERVELSKLVEAAVDVVRPDANAKGIVLDVMVPSDLPSFVGDAGRLQQVFWNLLSNAIKFTPSSGQIAVRVSQEDDFVAVQVTDTGQGIRPGFLPFVFDRFKQGDNPKGRSPVGLGLGLALVREMVQAHGGTVVAESRGEGQGSTFTVRLPISQGRVPATLPEIAVGRLEEPLQLDILIVDDDGDVRDLLGLLLQTRGATIRAASSAAEALEAIVRHRPDVLLADVGMPEEDGYSLIRKVRAHEQQQNGNRLPAIAVTAYATVKDREQALVAGYDWHVAKPVDPAALTRAIMKVTTPQEV
jgi:PAS domain S-box-containing protein